MKRAFTLMEVLVVVVILTVLTAVAVPSYRKIIMKVKIREAVVNMHAIGRALQQFYLANSDVPSVTDQDRENGEYVLEDFALLGMEKPVSRYFEYSYDCVDGFLPCTVWALWKTDPSAAPQWEIQQPGSLVLDVNRQEITPVYLLSYTYQQGHSPQEVTVQVSSAYHPQTCALVAGREEDGRCVVD